MDKTVLDDIYGFWFGHETPPDRLDPKRIEFWMRQNNDTDQQVRERFGRYIAEAAGQDWDICDLTREQAVALVVLFDHFPRNIFRTSGEAFAYDHLARDLARKLVAEGWSRFTLSERFILGLPFVHHEDMDDQDYAIHVISDLLVSAPVDVRKNHRFDLDQAIRHRQVIQRFGRFPHRNVMLGRTSTTEELQFMAEHGRGF